MKKTITFLGKEYQPTSNQEKYFWLILVVMIVPVFCVFYLTLLGIKSTIAFNSWLLAIILFFVLFLEVTINNDFSPVKMKLLPEPFRTLAFIFFFVAGVFA